MTCHRIDRQRGAHRSNTNSPVTSLVANAGSTSSAPASFLEQSIFRRNQQAQAQAPQDNTLSSTNVPSSETTTTRSSSHDMVNLFSQAFPVTNNTGPSTRPSIDVAVTVPSNTSSRWNNKNNNLGQVQQQPRQYLESASSTRSSTPFTTTTGNNDTTSDLSSDDNVNNNNFTGKHHSNNEMFSDLDLISVFGLQRRSSLDFWLMGEIDHEKHKKRELLTNRVADTS